METTDLPLHLLLPIVLVSAILTGQVFHRMGLPAVVGQIFSGVLLGPLVFGLIEPFGIEPGDTNGFHELAEIGLCVLLFKIGLETRIQHFTQVWRQALGVAIVGMILPMGAGYALGLALGWSGFASLFLGAALTATSIGVTASVVDELGLGETKEARIIMGAAVVDDILGLLLLSALTALTLTSESVGIGLGISLLQAIFFLGLAILVGPFVARFIDRVADWLKSEVVLLALAFGFLLFMAYIAEEAGLAAIIGSYAAGLVFSERDEEILERGFTPLTELFAPIFFVLIGSSISFNFGRGWKDVGILVILSVIAIATKFFAPWLIPGLKKGRAVIGSGIAPRGEVGLVFAQAGLTASIFGAREYSILALVLVVTTVVGPLMFRRSATRFSAA